MKEDKLSIVIPVLNEEENIKELVRRLHRVLHGNKIIYEIIFIDDHSQDGSVLAMEKLASCYPVRIYLKKGEKGKAQSILEGCRYANYGIVAFLDADLQYPPEVLPQMLEKIGAGSDIVVANRIMPGAPLVRKILHRGFAIFFSKLLHGLDCDTQAGMKVFRKKIIEEVNISPSPWTFDLEFLLRARYYGYEIGSVNIIFANRKNGKSKIVFWKAIWEIGVNAVKLKFKKIPCLNILSDRSDNMAGAGIACNGRRFITHTSLDDNASARRVLLNWQSVFIGLMILIFIAGLAIDKLEMAILFIAALSVVYFFDMAFNLYLVLKSINSSNEIVSSQEEVDALKDDELPVYSIFCPLFKEAHMIPGFLRAIEKLEWPKDKLDIMLLLEENDKKTIAAARAMALPYYVRIVVVPYSLPQTKPKACNYGLSFARGEYVVIYDAEDIPDPLQLKKAFLGFKKVSRSVGCLQAKLNYFNPHDNLLTRLFTAEYSLWFDVILPGLQSISTAIPLGGTSNHFRTKNLIDLEGWDSFNVTEDCDLGLRIFQQGFRTAIIDSVTYEEANSNLKNWLRQRSRWIKGYLQTYLVHMRHPLEFLKKNGIHALFFQLNIGGKTAFIFINPILWLATISYFALHGLVGDAIEKLYPPVIFYMATISLVFGNFLCVYYYMIGCAKRGHWSVIKYVFLVPFYWLLMSVAALIAAWQLIMKPHYWEKTNHGLSLAQKEEQEEAEIPLVIPEKKQKPFWERFIPAGRYGVLFSGKNIFFASLIVSNFLNFVFNVFLGRSLTLENLGLVTFINSILYLVMIFISAFASVVTREVAFLSARRGLDIGASFLRSMTQKGLRFTVLASIVWVLMSPFLSKFFNIDSGMVLLSFTPVITFGVISSVNQGFLQGNLSFVHAAAIFLAEAASKLILAFVFWSIGLSELIYAVIPISIVIAAVLSREIIKGKLPDIVAKKDFVFPSGFFASSLLAHVSGMLFLSFDVILVKHFLSPHIAGEYMILSLIGKMVYFFGLLPNAFMLPLISRDIGLCNNPVKTFRRIYESIFIMSSVGFVAFGIFGHEIALFIFGANAAGVTAYLIPYIFSILLLILFNTIVSYHLAKKNYIFTVISFMTAAAMITGIVLFHNGIGDVVNVILGVTALGCIVIHAMHWQEDRITYALRGLAEILTEIFSLKFPVFPVLKTYNKRILIFNWRDMRHRFAGGAEVYIESMAKRWAAEGNKVTIFSGNDGVSPKKEIINGVEIFRRGGFYLVYIWAFIYYIFRFRGKYDVIIDCQNGIPFFTPIYAKETVYCLIHHIHQEVFRTSLSKPLAELASFLEKELMPLVYRNTPIITVSESSKHQILGLGMGAAGVWVINPGIELSSLQVGEESYYPMILYLGRLKAYKSIDILIRAFKIVVIKNPEAVLVIAGSGEEDDRLKKLVQDMGFNNEQIVFTGKISDKEKIRLLQKSWMVVNPSMMEGWSIVTIEANACGTPVIASNVPGLRDSVKDTATGYLVEYGNAELFASYITKLIRGKTLRERMSASARRWAKNFDWQESSDNFYAIINRKPSNIYVGEKRTVEA